MRPIWKLLIALLVCTVGLSVYYSLQPGPPVQLKVEMSSSAPQTAQLFYDVGNGYIEADSEVVAVPATPANSFATVTFTLPRKTVFHLRLDPALNEGTFLFRSLTLRDQDSVFSTLQPTDLVSFNQIQTRSQHGDQVTFTTVPGANDPGIVITLHQPFVYPGVRPRLLGRFLLLGDSTLVFVVLLLYLTWSHLRRGWLYLRALFRRADSRLQALANLLSTAEFIQFDSLSLWFYSGCLLCFVAGTVADLNGSSIGIYGSRYHIGIAETPILGQPRPVRVDEWAFETPIIFNQVLREKPFRIEQSYPGNHRVALIANAPILHFTTVFRPQFWSFFVLPLDYAFAAYWQFKALLLLTGVFTLLFLITQCSFWSAAGSLWYFFSPCTQWTYSWPSALPEMTGLMCLTVVFACLLTVGTNTLTLSIAAAAFIGCSINWAMCAYLPHLIPLLWLGVVCFAAWCIAHRQIILQKEFRTRRLAAAGAALFVTAVTGLILHAELKFAILKIGQTIYPGARHYTGGSFLVEDLASHFFEWIETDVRLPPTLTNICEAAGFLWLAPVTLFLVGRLRSSRIQTSSLAALWLFFLVISCWLVLPLPEQVGHLLGLQMTGYTRPLPALGLANIAIVAVFMSSTGVAGNRMDSQQTVLMRAARLFGVVVLTFCALVITNRALGEYFSWQEVSIAAFVTASLIALLIEGRGTLLAAALIVPQALSFGAANPVQRGTAVITQSPVYSFIRSHQELLKGRWFAYSDQGLLSGFLAAAGCNVYTGLTYLPDVDHFSLFAAQGLSLEVLNRDGQVLAQAVPPNTRPVVEAPAPFRIMWHVSPADPLLKAIGIKYFAFDSKPSDAIAATLVPLTSKPLNGVWLYRAK